METYLLKTNLILAVFYLLYRTIIYRHSNHQFKRFVGLAILLFSVAFMYLPTPQLGNAEDYAKQVGQLVKATQEIGSSLPAANLEHQLSLFMVFYLIGLAFFMIRLLIGLFGLIRLYRRSNVSRQGDFTVVENSAIRSPFSFFQFLFIHTCCRIKPCCTTLLQKINEFVHTSGKYQNL